jgi:phosphoglycolate phosphatase-like HAD superfamily hydrolase
MPSLEYASIVFDCDGVLLDSNALKTQSFYRAALPYGESHATSLMNYHKTNGGISRYLKFQHFLDHMVPGLEGPGLDGLLERYANEVRDGLLACAIAQGLGELRKRTVGSRWHVVSGSDQAELRALLATRGLAELFDGGIFGSPDAKSEILPRELAAANIREPALFLGDSKYDCEVSLAHGLDFVFVSAWTEVEDWQEWAKAQDLAVIDRIADLLP